MKPKQFLIIFITLFVLLFPKNQSFSQAWQWQNPLPQGNALECVDYVDSLHGWFGTAGGTILYTSDGGKTWEIQYPGYSGVVYYAIDFINQKEGWAAGGQSQNVIIHTKNGGANWEAQHIDSIGMDERYIYFLDENYGWATGTYMEGGIKEILRTRDGGKTWESYRSGTKYDIKSIAFLDSLRGFACPYWGDLLTTVDGGVTWTGDSTIDCGCKQIVPIDSTTAWIVVGFDYQLWKTINKGDNWILNKQFSSRTIIEDLFFLSSARGWFCTGEDTENIYTTTDSGNTWTILREDIFLSEILFFDELNGWGLPYSYHNLLKTTDGGISWNDQSTSFRENCFLYGVDFIDDRIGWTVGYKGLIAKTIDGGENWFVQESGTETWLNDVFALDNERVWVVGWGGIILKTDDGGDNWEIQHYSFGSETAHRAVVFADSLNGWIVGEIPSERGWILHTVDGGDTWIEQTPDSIPGYSSITFINKNEGWAICGAKSYNYGAIYHTIDGGDNWVTQLGNLPCCLRAIHFIDENTGWATSGGEVFHTNDGGETWIINETDVSILEMSFIDAQHGWLTEIKGGVLFTDDGGETFTRQETWNTNTLQDIDFFDLQHGWAVGARGAILHTNNGGISFFEQSTPFNIPSKLILYPNYPNPFNSVTIITFSIPKASQVKTEVYDLTGRRVAVLCDRHYPAGTYSVQFDGSALASGIYILRSRMASIENPDKPQVFTRKMMLMK